MESIDIFKILAAVLALAVAIIGHEIMHGWVAYMYGDTTAKNAGRLSINPISHVDLVGTIIVPATMYFLPMLLGGESGFLFGWAKPVPINMSTVVRNAGYNGAMQVDLAGIVYNFTLAVFASIAIVYMHQPNTEDSLVYIFTYLFVFQLLIINVVLGVFNLLPIPQFDGAHFIMHLSLKYKIDSIAEFFYKNERYGIIIVLIVLMTPLKNYLLLLPVQTILNLLLS
ncbi:MAG: peptidase M50 [Sulfurimonas sp. RIFOXYD12_FULL_33_39]|uniref:site-2 protease family protein n=1 Tax=unclassified Sulfurimonas TaxID=2623549 RepID=UPI0008ADE393|nr:MULTISPECIES: site-2 protease family protein [unclassified Sulfurimonas]OHE09434.1 MAG: peptidase M50 [Sulfurimonas sp. RIFOXYD12_FULL_33_39]OHE12784.1 MAG: peptidase M50 [Sulfurimonas sp. RIFOXYD2_FULL_34_21]DAB27562.1 MAG TPA: site-2 protease family protein [Sulfurimonas sp. UBA10385]